MKKTDSYLCADTDRYDLLQKVHDKKFVTFLNVSINLDMAAQ